MGSIQIFNHPQFGDIRISDFDTDNPMFCVMDLCRALGYKNGRDALAKHVDDPDVAKRDAWVVTGKKADGTDAKRLTSISFVNESGMYSLILGSNLPQAKEFKHWVTSEVIPSIRKHGAYMTETTIESIIADPTNAIKLLQTIIEERQQRQLAEREVARLEVITMEQAEKIQKDAPKVEHHDIFMNAEHGEKNVSVRKFIAQAGINGERKFWDWMEYERKLIYRDSKDRPMPYAGKYRHFFAMPDKHNEKNDWSGTQLMITPLGKVELAKMYFKDHPENFYDNSKIKQLDLFNN